MNPVVYFGVGCVAYRLFDDGLANLLGLETLRHGTNFLNYLNIKVYGGDPEHGGKDIGSTKIYESAFMTDKVKKIFYILKDDEYQFADVYPLLLVKKIPGSYACTKRLNPKLHCFLSNYNFIKKYLPFSNCAVVFFQGTASTIMTLLTPTLHFRFNRIDPDRLQNDPNYSGIAYKTTQKVEAWRIDLLGTLLTGVNSDWLLRIKRRQKKFLTGIAQLVSCVALTLFTMNHLLKLPETDKNTALRQILIGTLFA